MCADHRGVKAREPTQLLEGRVHEVAQATPEELPPTPKGAEPAVGD